MQVCNAYIQIGQRTVRQTVLFSLVLPVKPYLVYHLQRTRLEVPCCQSIETYPMVQIENRIVRAPSGPEDALARVTRMACAADITR